MNSSSGDNYYLDYDLVRDPFPVDAVDKKLYLTNELSQRLNQIKALIVEGGKVVVVTSPAGAGKTALSRQIELLKNSNWKSSFIRSGSSTSIDVLAYGIVRQVSPGKPDDTRPPVSQVHKYLEYCANNKIVPVLIIDDAHKLPFKTLEFLLQLAELRYGETRFRIVLFADETMNDRLRDPRLKDLTTGVIQNIHIPSFSKAETRKYIDHRLSVSGNINDYPFTDQDFDQIYKLTGGLPKGINLVARQILRDRVRSDTSISPYRWHIIGFGLVLLIIITAYFLYFNKPDDQKIPEPAMTNALPAEGVITPEAPAPVAADEPLPVETAVTEAIPENKPDEINQPETTADIKLLPEELPASVVAEETIEEEPVTQSTYIEAEVTETPAMPPAESVAVVEVPVVQQEEIIPGRSNGNLFDLAEVPEYLSGIKGPDWLRQQPPGSYALQLISASELQNIEKLLSGLSGVQEELSGYVKYTPSGKSRYLLLYGIYADQESAKLAIQGMPEKFQSVNPWPRTIADIINELDQAASR